MAYEEIGELDKAENDFQRAKEINIEALVQRGQIRFDQGNIYPAIEDFTKAIDRDPKHFLAHYLRGLAYEEVGDIHKAEDDFQRAKEINADMFGLLKPHHLSRPSLLARSTLSDFKFEITLETIPAVKLPFKRA